MCHRHSGWGVPGQKLMNSRLECIVDIDVLASQAACVQCSDDEIDIALQGQIQTLTDSQVFKELKPRKTVIDVACHTQAAQAYFWSVHF